MIRIALFLILAVAICLAPAAAGEKILVSNQNNHTAELIDLATLKSLAVTRVGTQPLTAVVTHDRRYGLVTGVGFTTNAGDVTVLDLTAPGMPAVATVSKNARCYGVAATPDSKLAIVTRVTGSTPEFQLVDLTATPPVDLGKPVAIPGGRSAYGAEVSPDGKTAYLLDYSGATLTVLDMTQSPPTVLKQLGTNKSAIFMRLSNDGRRLVVSSITSPAQAGIWNTEGALPVKISNVPLGSNPGAIPSFEPGNDFAVFAASSGQSVTVVDAHSTPPAALGSVGSVGSDLRGVTTTTDGQSAWAAARSSNKLVEIDLRNPATPVLTSRSLTVAAGPNSLVAFGEVHAHGIPAVGSVYPVFLTSPTDAGKAYILAASFSTRPGIPLGSRTVPLNLDDLFTISQIIPAIFQNFHGFLNASGQAVALLNIPPAPALRGFGFYLAAVVVDPGAPQGIGTITNAEHIVLQ